MKRYIVAANIILLTASIYFGAGLAYKIIGSKLIEVQAPHRAPPAPEKRKKKQSSRSHYTVVVARNLFNTQEKKNVQAPAIDLGKLEKTRLPLKLLGTIVGENEDSIAVILKPPWRKQELHRVGDSIENAVVKMILWEKIVLSVDGVEEILEMENIARGRVKNAALQSGQTKNRNKRAARSRRKISLKRSIMEKSLRNINDLIKDVRISPYFKDGRPNGIRFDGMSNSSVFRRLGLTGGDILTGVNGKKIQSVEDAMSLYQSIKSAPGMRVEIIRRGRSYDIEYEFK